MAHDACLQANLNLSFIEADNRICTDDLSIWSRVLYH